MNTPKRPELSDADVHALAQRCGITPERLHLVRTADDARTRDYTALSDVALRSSFEGPRGLYIAESTKIIERALGAGHVPRSWLLTRAWFERLAPRFGEDWQGRDIFVGSSDVVAELAGFHLHRGALASMHRPPGVDWHTLLAQSKRIAVFEDITDHTNLGAAFRSAAALGVDAVMVTPRCADPLYRRSIRVSMGTVFQVPWARIEPWPHAICELSAAGFIVAGMTLAPSAIPLAELVAEAPERLALVFGTEGNGLAIATERLLDRRVIIPMAHGVDSLNVAVSAALAFYATQPS